MLLAYDRLFIADTLVTTPAGLGDWSIMPPPSMESEEKEGSTPTPLDDRVIAESKRPEGLNTYTFMYSIPNMIPLKPSEIVAIWDLLKNYKFTSTHGAFLNMDVYDGYGGSQRSVKGRVLDSMQIQVEHMGWEDHAFLKVELV